MFEAVIHLIVPIVSSLSDAAIWIFQRIFIDILLEFVIRGSGKVLLSFIGKKHEFSSGMALVVGLVFWVIIIAAIFYFN
jgi:hypothetical protein